MYWSSLKFLHWRRRDASFFVNYMYLKYSSIFSLETHLWCSSHLFHTAAFMSVVCLMEVYFKVITAFHKVVWCAQHSFVHSQYFDTSWPFTANTESGWTNTFEDDGRSIQWIPAGIRVSNFSHIKRCSFSMVLGFRCLQVCKQDTHSTHLNLTWNFVQFWQGL